jgi:hypothetical protein
MAYPVVEAFSKYNGVTRATTHSVTLPSGIVAGELLIAFPTAEGARLNSTNASGWNTALTFTWAPSGTTYRRSVFARIATADANDNLSISTTNGGPDGRLVCVVYRISGWGGNLTNHVKLQYATSTLTFPSLNITASNDALWLPVLMGLQPEAYGGAANGDSQLTLPTNYLNKIEQSCNNNWNGSLAGLGYPVVITSRRELTATAETPGSYGNVFDATTAAVTATPITVAILPADSAAITGITITGIKEPNESDTLVNGVSNARVKVWYGGDDTGAENALFSNQTITNGTMTVDLDGGGTIDGAAIVEVMWTVGSERKLFITDTTVVDLGSGS